MSVLSKLIAKLQRATKLDSSPEIKEVLGEALEYVTEQDQLEKKKACRARSMNPVTFRGREGNGGSAIKMAMTMGRLWVGEGGKDLDKRVTVAVYEEPEFGEFEDSNMRAVMVIPEEHLVSGLRAIFPNGELNTDVGN